MKWQFWRKSESNKTVLSVTLQNLTEGKNYYVEAQSPEKAIELMQKLRKDSEGSKMKLRKILNRCELEGGSLIPRGYGFAYFKYAEAKAVFYPIPLNLMVNFYRKIHEQILGPSPPRLNRMLHDAYMRGRVDALRVIGQRLDDTYQNWRRERQMKK